MKHSLSTFALCALLCGLLISPAAAFNIAKNGRAQAMIVTGAKPSVVISGMAEELAKYLKEMTGAEFTIAERKKGGLGAIRLVVDKKGKMKPESYAIKDFKSKKELVITGADDCGLVYGVYGFLERQGCGFWAPDRETVPKKPTFVVQPGYSVESAPAFTYRDCSWSESCWRSPWFCRKIGINHISTRDRIPEYLGESVSEHWNHSLAGVHPFINAKKHFDAHPEWYALRFAKGGASKNHYVIKGGEGKSPLTQLKAAAQPAYNKGKGGDLIRSRFHVCSMNPEMTKELIREVRDYLKADPKRKTVSIGPTDDHHYCQCVKCDEYVRANGNRFSALFLRLANQVALDIAKDFPDVTVYVLAYWMTEWPPVASAFKEKLSPNLAVCLACGMYRGPYCPIFKDKRLTNLVNDWIKIAPVVIWGYYANFANFMYMYDDIFNMGDDLRGYRDRGIKKISVQLTWGALSDFADLRAWLFGKLTWNPDQDERALIKQWVDGACGAGAPYINEYLNLRITAKEQKGIPKNEKNYMDGPLLIQSFQLIEKALAATKDDPASFACVEKLSAGFIAHIISHYTRAELPKAAAAAKVNLPACEALIDRLEGLFVKYKCEYVGENRYGYKGYIDLLRKSIKK